MSKYVEGYGDRNEGYDAPYHPSANFDPAVAFANAGDPEAAAAAQEERAAAVEVVTEETPEDLETEPDPNTVKFE